MYYYGQKLLNKIARVIDLVLVDFILTILTYYIFTNEFRQINYFTNLSEVKLLIYILD